MSVAAPAATADAPATPPALTIAMAEGLVRR